MDAEIKQKWLNALRSGEYKQGYGGLCDGTQFCCLGVLAHIQGMSREWLERNSGSIYDFGQDGPAAWPAYDQAEILSESNDAGTSFLDLANYIEKRL